MSILIEAFDWVGFANYLQDTFKSPVAPYGNDGEYWKNWELLRNKRIKNKDLERWIQDDNFAGFGIIVGDSQIPVAIGPTITQLQELNPFILAFTSLSPKKLNDLINWQHLADDINSLRKDHAKK